VYRALGGVSGWRLQRRWRRRRRAFDHAHRQQGDYSLGLSLTATFVVDPRGLNENLVATRGRIVVDEVTATSVRGGAAIELNADNTVNGQFQANVCPPR
jgi:hypothetical protein